MQRVSFFAFFFAFFAAIVAGWDSHSFMVDAGIPYSNEVATMTIMYQQPFAASWHTFANESYSPPSVEFNRVALELRVNTTGGNYDRLGQVFIGDTEIWRTSTAEPADDGTSWTVWKDVSHYGTLFNSSQTLHLLIQNQVSESLNGVFYATLVAHFYYDTTSKTNSDELWAIDLNNLPNQIQALSKSQNPGSWYAPGDDISVKVGPLDRSVNRAVVQILASGSGNDEFWWDSSRQGSNSAGPARFIDLYIGGTFAGFAAPYPTIFTGGINPSLWKPMVNIHTFDIPSYFIDVTSFLPSLWQESTSLSLNMTNGIDAEQIPSDWIINYNLLTWSEAGQSNTGTTNAASSSQSSPSDNSVIVDRSVSNSASLTIGGSQNSVEWKQQVAFNNTLTTRKTNDSYIWQETLGTASISGAADFNISYSYPFQCDMKTSKYYRVQQSHNVIANSNSYERWIDSSVNLNSDESFNSSISRSYLKIPAEAHFAETNNRDLSIFW